MSTATAQVFLLPDLGEGLTEAEIVRWLVSVNDEVAVDQPMVEVETAKSIVEVPSPFAGRVAVLHAVEGKTLPVGTPLITVEASGQERPVLEAAETYRQEEQAGSGNVLIGYGTTNVAGVGRRRRPRGTSGSAALQVSAASNTREASNVQEASRRAGALLAAESSAAPAVRRLVPLVTSPLVRALARDNVVDLRDVAPTGAGGLIIRADVERRIRASAPTADTGVQRFRASIASVGGGERRTPLSGFRKAVSANLSRSRSEIPEATAWVDVDATALWELRESGRSPDNPGPGLMAYLARFTVAALRQHTVLNARIDTERDEVVELDTINLGIAVQSQRGLVVPAVLGAEALTTSRLDQEIRGLTARAREGRSTTEELTTGTFTLNNYGSFRVDGSAAIINHPQVAILGFGRILDRAWVVDGQICVRKITQMSFVFDHRVCDGGIAAGFMRSVADVIENPASAIANL